MLRALKKIPPWITITIAFTGLIVGQYVWAVNSFTSKDTLQVVLSIVKETHQDVRELRKDLQKHISEE